MVQLVKIYCSLVNFLLFWLLGAFFQEIKKNKPSKIHIFLYIRGFFIKWGCRGHWGHRGCWGCWIHWGHLGSWCQGYHIICKVQAVILTKKALKTKNVENKFLKIALHLIQSKCFYQRMILYFYISSCRGRTTSKKWKLMNSA